MIAKAGLCVRIFVLAATEFISVDDCHCHVVCCQLFVVACSWTCPWYPRTRRGERCMLPAAVVKGQGLMYLRVPDVALNLNLVAVMTIRDNYCGVLYRIKRRGRRRMTRQARSETERIKFVEGLNSNSTRSFVACTGFLFLNKRKEEFEFWMRDK